MAPVQARPELVLNATNFNGIGLEAWGRPEGAERAPLAVVCMSGNPAMQFGSSHAKAPLISAVVKAMREARIPVVSFDYKGVGMSAPGGPTTDAKKWSIPDNAETTRNTAAIIALAKEHLADKLVLCGYSYGSSQAFVQMLAGEGHAFISLSLGFKVFMFMPDPASQQAIKDEMEKQMELKCRVLYVVGEKDRMTPLNEVQRLANGRSDGGKGATIEVIKGAPHDLKGLEDHAGQLCSTFVTDLHEELLPAKAPAAEPTPEAAPEAAPAAQSAPEVYFDFRITCLKPKEGSVFDSFHITLPDSATVGTLRAALGEGLPRKVEVCELDGMGFKVLKDDDAMPAWVTVEEINWAINMDMVLTMNQCKEAQEMMMVTLKSPKIQKKLDELEAQANKVETKYRILLTKMLHSEVYPAIVDHFSLPTGVKGTQMLLGSIPMKSDFGMIQNWLELEKLMRNKANIKRAEETLAGMIAQGAIGA